jgi:N-acetylmuramic acid 6-phosphate etherase
MAAGLLVDGRSRALSDEDIVASVTAFAADSIADQYRRHLPRAPDEVVVAGGGARNPAIMARLAARLPARTRLSRLEDLGMASHQKEAIAMAVLAYETWHGRPGTLPDITGADHPVVLGSLTPGRGRGSPAWDAAPVAGGGPTIVPGSDPRGGTEALDPRAAELDTLSTLEILRLMNEADATVPAVVRAILPELAAAVDSIAERLRLGGRLVYAGAGTSGRLAMLDAVECVPTFGVPPTLVTALVAGGRAALTRSVEGAEDDEEAAVRDVRASGLGMRDTLVGLAASGSTPYVVAALGEARARGALTVAVSDNDPAPILELADHPIAVTTGPEVVAGSTRLKAGTAQKLVLNMISTAVMIRLGKVYGNRMIDVAVTNRKLHARAVTIVADLVGCDETRASELLEAAGRQVPVAALMGLAGLDAGAARATLARVGGVFRDALREAGAAAP